MCVSRDSAERSAAPDAFQPLFGHWIAEIGRNPDEALAVALLYPRRHGHDLVRLRVAANGVERGMPREALERAPGWEDKPRFAAAIALQHLSRAHPFRARALAFDDARLPIPGRAARNEEQGVEASDRVE